MPTTDEMIVVLAELLLLAGVVSVTPFGALTVAVFTIEPLPPAVPDNVSVIVPPIGSAAITRPGPCRLATVAAAGQTAPPAATQLTDVALKFGTTTSRTTAPSAGAGPLLVTTTM